MSYERAWVIGVFGNALIKRHGGAPEHPAGDRIRVVHASGYKAIKFRIQAVLKIARVFCNGELLSSDLLRNRANSAPTFE